MKRPRIVAVGEVLWDLLPDGPMMGGAPANFAFHAAALGAEARLISRVGNDAWGRRILEQVSMAGLPQFDIQLDPQAPTGTVSVKVSGDGQPNYTIHEGVAWDGIAADAAAVAAMATAEAVCFGSLAQRSPTSREAIHTLLAAAPAQALKIFDINLRQNFYTSEIIEGSLAAADLLKINDAELPLLARMFDVAGELRPQLVALAERFGLQGIALTCGSQGSLLYHRGEFSSHPGLTTLVRDTVGAGDAFTAALAIGLLAGWPLDRINERANTLAAYVCSVPGATPALPPRLRSMFCEDREGVGLAN